MTIGRPNARPAQPRTFYGKYRGVVVDNVDPLELGRIMPTCPAISSGSLTWALPCVPWGGQAVGTFIIPPIGAGVWLEFEQGDIDYPIWTGCYWNRPEEVPLAARALLFEPGIAIQGQQLNSIVLGPGQSGAGSVVLQCGTASIELSEAEGIVMTSGPASVSIRIGAIQISNGLASIELSSGGVSVNDGALEIL
jgi:hypothetical protein